MPPKKKKQKPNDPCACGSGDKYKKCCMKKDMAAAQERASSGEVDKVRDKTVKKVAVKHDEAANAFRKQNYAEAEKIWLSSLEDARSVKHQDTEAAVLGNLGMVYLHTARYEQAVEVLHPAVDLAEDKQVRANHMGHLGLAYRETGDHHTANRYMVAALKLAESIGDMSGARIHADNIKTLRLGKSTAGGEAGAAEGAPADAGFVDFGSTSSMVIRERLMREHEEGKVAYNRGEQKAAIDIWVKCLEDVRTIKHEESEAAILGNLGMAYECVGEHREAIKMLEGAVELSDRLGDRVGLANHLLNLAASHASIDSFEECIKCQHRALDIYTADGNTRGKEGVFLSLGITMATIKKYDEAIAVRLKALPLVQARGALKEEGAVLNCVGQCYLNLGDFEQAHRYFEQALGPLRAAAVHSDEAIVLGNIGLVRTALGRPAEAVEAHLDALKVTLELGDRRGEGVQRGHLAVACLGTNRLDEAIEFGRAAVPLLTEYCERKTEGKVHGAIGTALLKLGRLEEAAMSLRIAVDIAHETGDPTSVLTHRSNLDRALGGGDDASESYDAVLTVATDGFYGEPESTLDLPDVPSTFELPEIVD
mmetsp:Transcript_8587/g.22163  ORF Transcript_8587/g.22163 Transcript_8587/m.22163 type:complete len:594 (+) Transcript_8587:215-1996(+)